MQITNKQPIDYFKVFKILDLKKIQKQGDVKIVQDKVLSRKILAVEGNVSTQNSIEFLTSDILKVEPNLSFSQRFLYIMGWADPGKHFCFQLSLNISAKVYKILYSTVYKSCKVTPQGVVQMPLDLKASKWTVMVIDLHEVCEKYASAHEIKLSFKLANVEIRANSKIKNIYLSDNLYDSSCLPKDMEMPLRAGEDFYSKYNYVVMGEKIEKEISKNQSINEISIETKNKGSKISIKQEDSKNETSKDKEISQTEKNEITQNSSIRAPMRSGIRKSSKTKEGKVSSKLIPDDINFEESHEDAPMVSNNLPKPKVTIELKIWAMEGRTLSSHNITTLEAFIIEPSFFGVHKPIKCMSLHRNRLNKLAVGYNDGSICIWDIVRQKSLSYLKTELIELKQLQYVGDGNDEKIFIVGLDKMRRETILIINSTDVLFKQISNYSINGFIVGGSAGEEIMVSFGFENIRLWKLNPNNSLITGIGLYLGKMNRKVTYRSSCLIDNETALVVDNSGYITRVSLTEQKMDEMKKVSENGLDFIINILELRNVLVAETSGTLKLFSYDLDLLEQFELSNRVKEMSYSVLNGEIVLEIDHHNSSVAKFNLNTSDYEFCIRQHSQKVIGLAYHEKLNKIISLSVDNTIRVWALISAGQKGQLEYKIKQEYEFLVSNGETLSCLALDSTSFVYVGFKGGLVRKIDLNKFEIVGEQTFIFNDENHLLAENQTVDFIDISRNNKNLLICMSVFGKGGRIESYVLLCDCNLQIINKYNRPMQSQSQPKHEKVVAGFNKSLKKMYICWIYGSINRLQIFSLSSPNQICIEFYLDFMPISINYNEGFLEVDSCTETGQAMYIVYSDERGEMVKTINLKLDKNRAHCIKGPLLFASNDKEQLEIKSLQMEIRETVDMPEHVSNLSVSVFREGNGLIICSGDASHSIYVIEYEVRNIEELRNGLKRIEKEEDLVKRENYGNREEEEEELECVENKLINFGEGDENEFMQAVNKVGTANQLIAHTNFTNHFEEDLSFSKQSNSFFLQQDHSGKPQPTELRALYEEEEEMFEECRDYILPQFHDTHEEKVYDSSVYTKGTEKKEGVELIYGWHNRYSYSDVTTHTRHHLFWQPASQSILLLSEKNMILHMFKNPICQKIVHLPTYPECISGLGDKYVGVGVGNQVRLYTNGIQYLRTFISLGEEVNTFCLSICEGYILIVSSSVKAKKSYIQIFDVLTSSILCSTYCTLLSLPISILISPWQKNLEFIISTPSNVYFYRMTSILTLQIQPLENFTNILHSTNMGDIRCMSLLKLLDEEILLLGMSDGSIVVIDSRANSVLMLHRGICGEGIVDILVNGGDGHKEDRVMIVIVTGSSLIRYELESGELKELIGVLGRKEYKIMTTDSQITLHSSIKETADNRLAMLVLTKMGVLWLIDLSDVDTIKIVTVHAGEEGGRISRGIISVDDDNREEYSIISGGFDGTVKETSLSNLEQIGEIYKPRRKVCDIVLVDKMLIAAYNMEILFYNEEEKVGVGKDRWKFSGLIDMQDMYGDGKGKVSENRVVGIKHIPYSDNYVVCTFDRLFIIYHNKLLSFQSGKLKLEIKEICSGLEVEDLHIMGFNHIMVRERNKINLWMRKERRGENTIEQMSKVEEVVYYMMDVYQVCAAEAIFVEHDYGDKGKKNGREYAVCLANRPFIQWRDFEQHTIVRELEIGVSNACVFKWSNDGHILVGDDEGTVWLVQENGLTLKKIKVFDSQIRGIEQFKNGKLVIYGPSLAIVNIC